MRLKIIIPVFNPPDDFLETLSALTADGLEDSVIVVDDGSTNGVSQKIHERYPAVEVLTGNGNLWWAGGMRMGMARALEHEADVICWLNHDCIPDSGTIAALAEEACKPGSGAVTAWCLSRGYERTPVNPGFRNFKSIPEHELRASDKVFVDGVNGNCVAISVAAIRKIGLPDQIMHPHYGDGPYTWRLHKAGFTNVVLTNRHASLSREMERCIDEQSHSMVWKTNLSVKFKFYLFSPRSKFHWKNKFHDLWVFRGALLGLILYPFVQAKLLISVANGHYMGNRKDPYKVIEIIVNRYKGKLPEQGLRVALSKLSQS